MSLSDMLQKIETNIQDGDYSISISFNRLETKFDERNRMMTLFSDVKYTTNDFVWESTLPTVMIPYKDPSLGFMIDGVIFSIVGIYSRSPGIVPDIDRRIVKGQTIEEPKLDIVNERNASISLCYKRNAIQIVFKRNTKSYRVPIGVFLKAITGLPYKVILEKFAYKPQELCNSFVCSIPLGSGKDLSKVDHYSVDGDEEPSIDECVSMVYNAINQIRSYDNEHMYTTSWKVNRIKEYLDGLHFKKKSRYEFVTSLASRTIGLYLDQDLIVPYFDNEVKVIEKVKPSGDVERKTITKEVVKEFRLPRGHFITVEDSNEIRKFDIETLRVKGNKNFVLQEDSSMVFRAKGYKLVDDIPELGVKAGTIIDDDLLKKINETDILYLEVNTPSGRKMLHRSGDNVELGDFITILNFLFTQQYCYDNNSTQYEVSNRIILDYDKQVQLEVEQTYNDIVSAIVGSTELKNILSALPQLPSRRLSEYLRDAGRKEIVQSDLTNVMSRAISETKASALMKETPPAMMPIQKGQYARLDSLHSPDSDKVGSVQQMTVLARINDNGEIEAPYEKIINGVPTGEIVYITASKENNKYIVPWDCELEEETVLARYNDAVIPISKYKVDYRDPSPFCDMSVSRMCIPFPEFSQSKRAVMATRMSGQAISILKPERPIVSTGAETEVPSLYFTGRKILEMCGITVVEGKKLEILGVSWKKNLVEYKFLYNDIVFEFSLPFTVTDKESLYHYNQNINGTNVYNLDDIIFYNQGCDIKDYNFWARVKQGTVPLIKDYKKPAMALGTNLWVGFKTYGSVTMDDAVVINQRLVDDNTLSNIQIFRYSYKLKQGEFFSDVDWCPPLYSRCYNKQPIIKIMRESSSKGVTEKEMLCKQEGTIVFCERDDKNKNAEVWVATYHQAQVGDKVAGRYGDKSVIAKIVPDYMMPYDPDTGKTLDIVASPLGMPSRMNFGRVLEVALGAALLSKQEREGVDYRSVCTPFYPNIKQDIIDLYNSENLQPKRLFNPVYGKLTERPVMTGVLYIMKLEQMSNLKMSAVGYPVAVDPVFGEPVESLNYDKGQSMEEMITWSLIASGAHKTLNSLFTVYSDDEEGRRKYFELLESSKDTNEDPWDESSIGVNSNKMMNRNAVATQTVFRMFGCDVEVIDNKFVFFPLNMNDIQITLSKDNFYSGNEQAKDYGGFKLKDYEWFKVPLAAPVINPFWIYNFPLKLVLGVSGSIKALVEGRLYLDLGLIDFRKTCLVPSSSVTDYNRMRMLTGIEAVIELVKNTTVQDALDSLRNRFQNKSQKEDTLSDQDVITGDVVLLDDDFDYELFEDLGDLGDVPMKVADLMRFLERMKRSGRELSEIIWYDMPIMPRMFRQANIVGNKEQEHSFQQQLKSICSSSSTSQSIYESLKDLIGYGTSKRNDLISVRGYFFGKGSQAGKHGKIRSSVLSKRVGFSGRLVITPMADINISPFFVGLPWRSICTELGKVFGMRLKNREDEIAAKLFIELNFNKAAVLALTSIEWQSVAESLGEFNPTELSKYFVQASVDDLFFIFNYLRSIIKELVEGKVSDDGLVFVDGEWRDPTELPEDATLDCIIAMTGRQPTLHKKSLRSFFVKLIDGYTMHIHPTVCSSYNADFDGDTMWHVQLLGECKVESCKTISVLQDLVSEKDGSYTLELLQDSALGIYCAATYKDNKPIFEGTKGNYYFFDSIDKLQIQLEYGDLHYYDVVVFHNKQTGDYYISTAGRILLNGKVPGCFTKMSFTDSNSICKQVLGEEYIGCFKELLYDCIWTGTSIKPEGIEKIVKISDILLDVYRTYGGRESIMTVQRLYEVGLVASDIYSVSLTLDDMSSSVDKTKFMEEPENTVVRLNSLYQYGLITEESRKNSSIHAWDNAKKQAQEAVINSLPISSNISYMMYSGARGKPDQVMQSIGFIGNISKTAQDDIEYPVLRGFGEGLTSLDSFQTRYPARIGIIATNSSTKETGYATRQSVYMTSGYNVHGEHCGITWRAENIDFSSEDICIVNPDGTKDSLDILLGEFVSDSTESFNVLKSYLNKSGYMITDDILDLIIEHNILSITLLSDNGEKTVKLEHPIDEEWKDIVLDKGYSYALPYTIDMKITQKTLDWLENSGLTEIILFTKEEAETGSCFDKEAYLPVDYDTSKYDIYIDEVKIDEETLLTCNIKEESEGFYYYKELLSDDNLLTMKAIRYLTKKKIRSILLKDGRVVNIKYMISDLFKSVIEGRVSKCMLGLDEDECITKDTIAYIEEYQLEYIPVATGLTCLSTEGICSSCYGKSLSSKDFMMNNDNLGIAASQAMCEPLSQATLNVGHSGGKRGAGTGLVSGLSYYKRMLQGTLVTERTKTLLESFAPCSGYISYSKNGDYINITDDKSHRHTISVSDISRVNVPNGVYVDKGDTIINGLTDLTRYDSTDIFSAALKTRYLLMKEYYRIFKALNVSARNTEILARAQTSICYLVGKGSLAKTKDTGEEAANPTGNYKLSVSCQSQVVNWFTGIASYGFENVANMMLMGLFTPEGLKLNSCLGNLITGTEVGSDKANFIPRKGGIYNTKYEKSAVKVQQEITRNLEHSTDGAPMLSLGVGNYGNNYSLDDEEEMFNRLIALSAGDEIDETKLLSEEHEAESYSMDDDLDIEYVETTESIDTSCETNEEDIADMEIEYDTVDITDESGADGVDKKDKDSSGIKTLEFN